MNTSQDPYSPPQASQVEIPQLTADGKLTPIIVWARLAQTGLLLYSGLSFTMACAALLMDLARFEGLPLSATSLFVISIPLLFHKAFTFVAIANLIFYSIWVYKATENAILLNRTNSRLNAGPGYAVIQYFVPILNLWKPYSNMKQVWTICIGKRGRFLVHLWWFSWISTIITITFFSSNKEYIADTWRALAIKRMAVVLLTLIAAITLVTIINRLSKKQSNAKLSSEVESKAPQI